jgi:hypothetical protein
MRKRGHRKPQYVFNDPLSIFKRVAVKKRNTMMLRYLSALESIATGSNPTVEELKDLSDVMNICETLAVSMGRMDRKEVCPIISNAASAIADASERYREGKTIRMDGHGLEAMRTLIDIYRQCIERLSEMEMTMATEITNRRLEKYRKRQRLGVTVIQL